MSDHEDALRYAFGAGEILLALRAEESNKGRSWSLGDRGDHEANVYLLEQIAGDHPNDCILSEESSDISDRLNANRSLRPKLTRRSSLRLGGLGSHHGTSRSESE